MTVVGVVRVVVILVVLVASTDTSVVVGLGEGAGHLGPTVCPRAEVHPAPATMAAPMKTMPYMPLKVSSLPSFSVGDRQTDASIMPGRPIESPARFLASAPRLTRGRNRSRSRMRRDP